MGDGFGKKRCAEEFGDNNAIRLMLFSMYENQQQMKMMSAKAG